MTHPRGMNELYLQLHVQTERDLEPRGAKPRTARRIAIKARHRQARQLGNL
ncbi:hypothetical protein [Hamadaea tsunoensis]|uniref:hypothetical protein n=1 Tax=Hamadaea tsunoensis TaxID=53368 RepID=UPI0012F7E06F|nr:hypothetical protein [Hamadaea tsunoensis]